MGFHAARRVGRENFVVIVAVGILAITEVAANLAASPPPRRILGDSKVNGATVVPHHHGGERRHTFAVVSDFAQTIFKVNPKADVTREALER